VPEGNEYDQLLQRTRPDKATADAAKFVASKRDPERWAKVLDIAKRTKLPAEVVDRNFDDQRRRSPPAAGAEYDRLISDTPGSKSWLENPDNATWAATRSRLWRASIVEPDRDAKG
jgi:hypothetical protein